MMKTWPRAAISIWLLLIIGVPLVAQPKYIIGGYYPAWRSSFLSPANLAMHQLTHIIHAFAWPDSNGIIHGYSNVPDPALIVAVHDGGGRISVALGGYGNSDGFVRVATDPAVRRLFVDTLKYFVGHNGYDGVDIDWEWPQTVAQRESLVSLVRDVRTALDDIDPSTIVTMSVPTGDYSGQWINFAELLPYVSWFNAMTYDYHGSWSTHAGHNAPLYAPSGDQDGSVDQGIKYLNSTRGIPKDRLVLGLPFYAKEFIAPAMYAAKSGETDILYDEVVSRITQGWNYIWDAVSQVPYLTDPSNTKVVTFDDSLSLTIKCQYAKTQQLAGVIIWALSEDLVGQSQPLMSAVGQEMTTTSVGESRADVVIHTYALNANFPNPFNPTTAISYELSARSMVTLKVYDILGRGVETLVNDRQAAGKYAVTWDASRFASGVYIYRLMVGNSAASRIMVLLK